MEHPQALRVCAVSYLNTLPLVWGMLYGEQRGRFAVEFASPAECADRLAAGSVDIGIVPSVELLRLDLEILPGAGIACHGPIRSILLISKGAPQTIRTLAADSASRTSVILARIILEERYGARPQIRVLPPELPAMLAHCDAALIIGDPALRVDLAALPYRVLDLGAEWLALTGLPMVFAVWAARRGIPVAGLAEAFVASCRYGRSHLDEILIREASARGIPEDLARQYLYQRLVNELGPEEYLGLRVFLERARRLAQEVGSCVTGS